VKTILENEHL